MVSFNDYYGCCTTQILVGVSSLDVISKNQTAVDYKNVLKRKAETNGFNHYNTVQCITTEQQLSINKNLAPSLEYLGFKEVHRSKKSLVGGYQDTRGLVMWIADAQEFKKILCTTFKQEYDEHQLIKPTALEKSRRLNRLFGSKGLKYWFITPLPERPVLVSTSLYTDVSQFMRQGIDIRFDPVFQKDLELALETKGPFDLGSLRGVKQKVFTNEYFWGRIEAYCNGEWN